jgi:NADH:ubiquinone oxidoreductase subunit K
MFFFLLFSFSLFIIGSFGMFLSRKHIIIILISLELILLAVNINFVIFPVLLDDFLGQIFALLVLTVAAAETALGLAILIVYYRLRGGISIDLISLLKG